MVIKRILWIMIVFMLLTNLSFMLYANMLPPLPPGGGGGGGYDPGGGVPGNPGQIAWVLGADGMYHPQCILGDVGC